MYKISKDFSFSASHVLNGLPDGHQCGRLHGHNYVVRVTLSSPKLGAEGFVFDYGNLSPFKRWIDDTLDHRHLNDLMIVQPSAENIARWLSDVAREQVSIPSPVTVSVSVSETPKTWARWTP